MVVFNSSLEWKLVGSASGKNTINLPSNWNELSITTIFGTSICTAHVLRSSLDFSLGTLLPNGSGGYISTNGGSVFSNYNLTQNTLSLRNLYDVGKDVSTNSTTKVYYK